MSPDPVSTPPAAALVVEAEPAVLRRLCRQLEGMGYAPFPVTTVEEALDALASTRFALTILALSVAGSDGTEVLRRLRADWGDAGPVIALINGHDTDRVAAAGALGVEDFLQKPFTAEDLESAVRTATSEMPSSGVAGGPGEDPRARLLQELSLWRSSRMREVLEIISQAARVDVTVLVSGETGVGKDLVARAVHDLSARRTGPFVKVNCAAVPRELLESELFGHERGAFTGAHKLKLGKFEAANNGTIFLDEIGDLHPALQGKLLHVLHDGQFSRVGGRTSIKVDVRVLAATNRRLDRDVAAGRFREDLLYRLDVIHIEVPPLRERADEIPLLVDYFVERYAAQFQRGHFRVPRETMRRLQRYRYPGNVRELENLVKRMIVLEDPRLVRSAFLGDAEAPEGDAAVPAPGAEVAVSVTAPAPSPAPKPAEPARVSLKDVARRAAMAAERKAILHTLAQTNWNRVRAARLLDISYRALLYKIKEITQETPPSPEAAP